MICKESKNAWKVWNDAGRPATGPLFRKLRQDVKKRIRHCAAMDERKMIMRMEEMFKRKYNRRFSAPHKKKSSISKLRVDGKVITEEGDLMMAWATHFGGLCKSMAGTNKQLCNKINIQAHESRLNDEFILDVPFRLAEIECAVTKLKLRKACGPDDLTAEHLKWGGCAIICWLKKMSLLIWKRYRILLS